MSEALAAVARTMGGTSRPERERKQDRKDHKDVKEAGGVGCAASARPTTVLAMGSSSSSSSPVPRLDLEGTIAASPLSPPVAAAAVAAMPVAVAAVAAMPVTVAAVAAAPAIAAAPVTSARDKSRLSATRSNPPPAAKLAAKQVGFNGAGIETTVPAAGRRMAERPEIFGMPASAPPDARYVVEGQGIVRATVREPARFTVSSYDAFGKQEVPIGSKPFHVAVNGPARVRARIVAFDVSMVTVEWKPSCSGHYTIMVSRSGVSMPGSPFVVTATAPEPHAPSCIVRGEALYQAISRENNKFEVEFKDLLGCVTHAVDLDVFAEPLPAGIPVTQASHAHLAREREQPEPSAEDQLQRPKQRGPVQTDGIREEGSVHSNAAFEPGPKLAAELTAVEAVSTAAPFAEDDLYAVDAPAPKGHETRHRRIRVKVGERPLIVRAGFELDSEQIGQLLPGAIFTVVEERVTPGNIRARIALDSFSKETASGVKSERGLTFRSTTNTYRGDGSVFPTPKRATDLPIDADLGANGVAGGDQGGKPAARRHSKSATRKSKEHAIGNTSASDVSSGLTNVIEQMSALPLTSSGPQSVAASNAAAIGAAHARVIRRLVDLQLPAMESVIEGATPHRPVRVISAGIQRAQAARPMLKRPNSAAASMLWGQTSTDDADDATDGNLAGRTGWVTLTKDGSKLVTSKLRLDCHSRYEQVQQWTRRLQHQKLPMLASKPGEHLRESEKRVLAGESPSLPIALELASDPASFAFGGVFPGILHAHGKLHEVHRVMYSVGVAGKYLLHVRLRKQAVALPGSPFLLEVEPGKAHALSSRLPLEPMVDEVGEWQTIMITTADSMGNSCSAGGSSVTAGTTDLRKNQDADGKRLVQSRCEDLGDGTYRVQFRTERPGTYETFVTINGEHVVNSPKMMTFLATKPVLAKSKVTGGAMFHMVVREPSGLHIELFDQFGNAARPTKEYRASFRPTLSLLNMDDMRDLKEGAELPEYEYTGEWMGPEGVNGYSMSFTPTSVGEHEMHLFYVIPGVKAGSEEWQRAIAITKGETYSAGEKKSAPAKRKGKEAAAAESAAVKGQNNAKAAGNQITKASAKARAESSQERIPYPGSPFVITVERNSNEHQKEIGGTAPHDYAVERAIFDDACKMWGAATIDAFASEATAMLPRYWSQLPDMPGAEGTDSLNAKKWKIIWKKGEIVWAHPPVELLNELSEMLKQKERIAETIVCAPVWSATQWFRDLYDVSDQQQKFGAGKLHKVAEDAPARLEEWPIILFHVPARNENAKSPQRAGATRKATSLAPAKVPPLPLNVSTLSPEKQQANKREGNDPTETTSKKKETTSKLEGARAGVSRAD